MALALLLLPSLAHAERFIVGASAGLQYFDSSPEPATDTLGLFARARVTPRLGLQAELQRVDAGQNTSDLRETALLVVELSANPRWAPILVAGGGLEQYSQYGAQTSAHHLEGGFGLEYRANGGFVIGADARIGGRTIDSQPNQPVLYNSSYALPCCGAVPSTTNAQYYSGRLYVGAAF
jgi:hypothetical protein